MEKARHDSMRQEKMEREKECTAKIRLLYLMPAH